MGKRKKAVLIKVNKRKVGRIDYHRPTSEIRVRIKELRERDLAEEEADLE